MEQALIVDDSKTARALLRKKLLKFNIAVAMVESGEEALNYLKNSLPSVIFMDHMMPGMDGFAAVKAIKSDPKTSSIPIVMHTSKKGALYIGQAKALGAADIYTKPGSDTELLAVLDRVHRINRKANVSVNYQPIDDYGGNAIPVSDSTTVNAHFAVKTNESYRTGEPLQNDSHIVDSVGFATLKGSVSKSVTSDTAFDEGEISSFYGTFRQWLIAFIWLAPSLWLLYLYLPLRDRLELAIVEQEALYSIVQWSINQQESYDYGEIALSGERLERLQSLLPRLASANFHGLVRLEGHVGEFCMSKVYLDDGSALEILPPFEMPITECAQIGSARDQARSDSILQSDEFGRYLLTAKNLYPDIEIDSVAIGAYNSAIPYPEELDDLTAGEWNEVALANNQVYFRIIAR